MFIDGGFVGYVRALCDTGAQPNLAMHRVIKNFKHKGVPAQTCVNGISNQPVSIKRKISIEIRPWFDSEESITADFLILPASSGWCPVLPDSDLPNTLFTNLVPSKLADPLFWKCEPVHLLLGIEIWARLTCSNAIEVATGLVTMNTRFGEIVLGKLFADCAEQGNYNHSVQVHNGFTELTRPGQFWAFEDINLCS